MPETQVSSSVEYSVDLIVTGFTNLIENVSGNQGRAMAQVVSRRLLTVEARVRARANPCGICGLQSGTGTGFPQSSLVFPCKYIVPPSLSKLISSAECVIC
jgi:hypothetical protein